MKEEFLYVDKEGYSKLVNHLENRNSELNAFNFIDKTEKEGKIISVKDNICVQGIPATASSKVLSGYVPNFNATVVDRLQKNGFAVVGKTNMDEFGFGSFGINSDKIAHNPFDQRYVAGGSSSGSAIATAIIKNHISIAESTGGSISTPASFCGVVGLTPTYGAISRYGLIDYANSLDKIGVMGRNSESLKYVMNIVSGQDEKDTTSVSNTLEEVRKDKLYVIDNFTKNINQTVLDRFEELLSRFSSDGYKIEHVKIDNLDYSLPAYYILSMAEASTNLAKYQGFKYGHKLKQFSMGYNEFFTEARKDFGMEAKRRIILGTFIRGKSFKQKYYEKALSIRAEIIKRMKSFLKEGFIISPTAPILTPKIDEVKDITPVEEYSMDMLTIPPNLCGFPHISFPYNYE
ncbi:MAG: Amidase [Candidatus Parvarchaeum acidophilus ARMAN-5]|uniref:Amidase n=1 Tax=Candidatus Parvarchaeum acidophilus ARMAN-5 TaxID=662762 RepID=D6GUE3_PARA5|nr:MAG: Amidase [Candidatus Parvarchaeum acidophilus ARMAN-5]